MILPVIPHILLTQRYNRSSFLLIHYQNLALPFWWYCAFECFAPFIRNSSVWTAAGPWTNCFSSSSGFLLSLSKGATNFTRRRSVIPLIVPIQIPSLSTVHEAQALIAPAPASYLGFLLWLLALASCLIRRPARPTTGARAVSCSATMSIPPAHGFEFCIVVGKSWCLSHSALEFASRPMRQNINLSCCNTDALEYIWYSMETQRCYREEKYQSRIIQ